MHMRRWGREGGVELIANRRVREGNDPSSFDFTAIEDGYKLRGLSSSSSFRIQSKLGIRNISKGESHFVFFFFSFTTPASRQSLTIDCLQCYLLTFPSQLSHPFPRPLRCLIPNTS